MNLTKQQQQTVVAPLENILVSAAAGSGKTSTMTERIVGRIAREDLDIRNVLVMTFTDAAARNMRDKIEKQLRVTLKTAAPELQATLQKQLAYLGQSAISTIHAFCLDVIRNFYYEATDDTGGLMLEPGFRIEETGESEILLSGALDDLFEKYYVACDTDKESESSRAFLFLADAYGAPKDDQPLRSLLRSFYRFLRSMPDYNGWIEQQKKMLDRTIEDYNRSTCCRSLLEGLSLRAVHAENGLEKLGRFLSMQPNLYKNEKKNEKKNRDALDALNGFYRHTAEGIRIAKDPDAQWDRLYSYYQNPPELPALRHGAGETEEKAEWIDLFTRYFAEFLHYTTGRYGTGSYGSQFLYGKCFAFAQSKDEILHDLSAMRPAIWKFFGILADLDKAYAQAKREANMIDFDDFEHLALKILKTPEVKHYYHDKFKEIYIDEYQDTSSIQEAILQEVIKDNCFMVGDVKQSIYKFRHARPQIFQNKKETFANRSCKGTVFELNTNFRSVAGILNAVNDVFYQIMSEHAGEIDYEEDQALVPNRVDAPEVPAPVEILLVDLSQAFGDKPESPVESEAPEENGGTEDIGDEGETTDPQGEELSKYGKEAFAVALRIKDLLKENVRPGDIAVLARTRSICAIFAETIQSFGFPVEQEQGEAFLDRYEQKVIEALLIILDNPMQDIPLVSVMRSALFENGFSEEELLDIRIAHLDRKYFYECCESYALSGQNSVLKEKLKSFYQWLSRLRDRLVYQPVSELIETVYTETGFLAVAAKMPDGLRRIASLQEFQDWAREYDQSRQAGLYSFIQYMKAVHEKTPEQSPFGIEQSRADSIKVMTVHKSKGLEYSVVFLVGNNRSMASRDIKDPILVSEESGIGFQYVDVERQFGYPTPLILAMRENMRKTELAEEMRLLYVGMTRAENRLFITGTCSSADHADGKGLAALVERVRECPSGSPLPPHVVLSAKSPLEWIMMSIARNPFIDLGPLAIPPFIDTVKENKTNGNQTAGNAFHSRSWSLNAVDYRDVQAIVREIRKSPATTPDLETTADGTDRTGPGRMEAEALSPEKAEELYKMKFLHYYSYDNAVRSPLKISVSEIKRREQTQVQEPVSDQSTLFASPYTFRGVNTSMKALDRKTGATLDKSEIGIAVHRFLRYMDLERLMADPTDAAIREHLDRMLLLGMVQKAEHTCLISYTGAFKGYLCSDLARRILTAERQVPSTLFREIPFTIKMDCRKVFGEQGFGAEDSTFVQGMIDCWFVENGEAVLVDYKTDRIDGDADRVAQILEDRYRTQLAVYSEAIAKVTGLRVKESILWLVDRQMGFIIETKDAFASII